MRFIKLAAISLLIIFILFTFIGLLMPSFVVVGRSENINASIDSVRIYTNNLNNWKYWLSDTNASFNQPEINSTNINSKINLGNYIITISKIDSNRIITLWQTAHENTQLSNIELHYNSNEKISVVNWSFKQKLSWYPWERMGGMLHDKILGPQMKARLFKLKQVVEKSN